MHICICTPRPHAQPEHVHADSFPCCVYGVGGKQLYEKLKYFAIKSKCLGVLYISGNRVTFSSLDG